MHIYRHFRLMWRIGILWKLTTKKFSPKVSGPSFHAIGSSRAAFVSLITKPTTKLPNVQSDTSNKLWHRSSTNRGNLLKSSIADSLANSLAQGPDPKGSVVEGGAPTLQDEDTVFALSSGAGVPAGVAVIRISGPRSREALEVLSRPPAGQTQIGSAFPQPRRACVRRLFCPMSKELLDESLVLWMPGPRSFTGEDTVELHIHGSRAVLSGVLEALQALEKHTGPPAAGSGLGRIRMAERGEFTQRAFEHGRLDLTEVEGLADLIAADTAAQRRQALRQLGGGLSLVYDGWRKAITRCLAHAEAYIDFADDEHDVAESVLAGILPDVRSLVREMKGHLADGHRGEIIRTGMRVAIVGPPNAGKSTLLNMLAQRPAAIVSPIAGTTRDVVEVQVDLGGVPVILSDTAGLHEAPSDIVEEEGMARARQAARGAHLAVFVVDGTQPDQAFKLLKSMDDRVDENGVHTLGAESVVVVANKRDLMTPQEEADAIQHLSSLLPSSTAKPSGEASGDKENCASDDNVWVVSCNSGDGTEEFLSHLATEVKRKFDRSGEDAPLITRSRHRTHIERCVQALETAALLANTAATDLAAEELRVAALELGRITGAVDVEEVLDVIFRDFCIGK